MSERPNVSPHHIQGSRLQIYTNYIISSVYADEEKDS
ncbi:Unannotated [Lentimonas sp. CC19]|nr:Unannotated [Lentimonas sp. CC4]CAA6685632.1 Unannotated [Lentimonas sp. CC6]CAA6689615.1 Unannotated [Lentimonas sp. CC19]CAA6692600.1 Unannotated [Lentimonas sp. CC10]CAA7069213.1 Unannotated [Lentimonas sp. CC11]CAA7168842.1 Unannotated [Lentimonas sp. CC21]CAA7180795.1 Unannotated [Lentimonas sp. CC8]